MKILTTFYLFFTSELGEEKMQPIGYLDISRFGLIDLFMSCAPPDVKDSIIQSFVKPMADRELLFPLGWAWIVQIFNK